MNSNLVTAVTDDSYEVAVQQSKLPVLIDFWAPWCAPCVALLPTIDAVADLYADRVKVVKINIDESKAIADKFGIRSIPMLFLVKDGNVLAGIHAQTRTRICAEIDKHVA